MIRHRNVYMLKELFLVTNRTDRIAIEPVYFPIFVFNLLHLNTHAAPPYTDWLCELWVTLTSELLSKNLTCNLLPNSYVREISYVPCVLHELIKFSWVWHWFFIYLLMLLLCVHDPEMRLFMKKIVCRIEKYILRIILICLFKNNCINKMLQTIIANKIIFFFLSVVVVNKNVRRILKISI